MRRRRPRRNYRTYQVYHSELAADQASELAADRASELAADRARDRARADAQRQDEQDRVRERLRRPADGNRPAGLGERESGRVEHADGNRPATLEVNNKLQQLMLCSSKSMSTSLLLIRRSLSTRMDGPWRRCRRASSRSYGQYGTSAGSCARSGGTRMRSARIPLSTCEFCDAGGTHVQV